MTASAPSSPAASCSQVTSNAARSDAPASARLFTGSPSISVVADKLRATIKQSFTQYSKQMLGKRIWLACSGGRDSLALAHIMHQLYQQGQLPFCPQLIHINHGLQPANEVWAKQVARWANQQGMPCRVIKLHGVGKDEKSARQARYQAMMGVMHQHDVLLLAHHADDQAETLLMRLFTGAGVTGLAGMQAWTTKTNHVFNRAFNHAFNASSASHLVDSNNTQKRLNTQSLDNTQKLNTQEFNNTQKPTKPTNTRCIYLWRPWLTVTRDAITQYASDYKLPYVDDPTNVTGDNARSWLRQTLMPVIQQRYPQAINAINRSASLLTEADEILLQTYWQDWHYCHDTANRNHNHLNLPDKQADADTVTSKVTSRKVTNKVTNKETIWKRKLYIPAIQALPPARQRLLLHKWLQLDEPTPPSKQRVQEVLDLVHRTDNDHQTQLFWQAANHGYDIRRYRDNLYRLRHDWLAWLQLPITLTCVPNQPDQKDSFSWNIKQDTAFTWQILIECTDAQHTLTETYSLADKYHLAAQHKQLLSKDDFCIKPLTKMDKVDVSQLTLIESTSTTVQLPIVETCHQPSYANACIRSGKTLQQTLGIPSWERKHVLLLYYQQQLVSVLSPSCIWQVNVPSVSMVLWIQSKVVN